MMKHFLLIDDDVTFATVLSRALARRGYVVEIAHDGESALQILRDRTRNEAITHAILDLKLTETTGLQLLPKLLDAEPSLQVVVLTGYASVATTVEAIKQGAVNYLCKPATVEEILSAFGADVPKCESGSPLSVDRVEWEYIQRQLAAHHGNIAATARALGMHRRTLQRKLQKRPGKF